MTKSAIADVTGNTDELPDVQSQIDAAVAAALAAHGVGSTPPPVRDTRRMRIVLEENDLIPPTGQFFGTNGRPYLLRPGEEADVPMEIIGALDDAIMETPIIDANGNIEGYRKRLRFPYRVISAAR